MFRRSSPPADRAVTTEDPEVVTVTEESFLDDTGGEVALIDF